EKDNVHQDQAGLVGSGGELIKTWTLDGAWGDVYTSPGGCGFWHANTVIDQAQFISLKNGSQDFSRGCK
ncbi:MAG: hypothetical protein ABEJ65_04680, partial [bacterium]